MTGSVRRCIRRAKADGGFTLIELLVAISLGLVVLIGATTMMLTTQRFARSSAVRNSNTLDAGLAVQAIEKYLGSTTAICGVGTLEQTCAKTALSTDQQKGEILAGSSYRDMSFYSNFGDTEILSSNAQSTGVGPITAAAPGAPGYRAGPYKVRLWVSASGDLRADLYVPSGIGAGSTCCTWPATPTFSQLLAQQVKVTAPSGTLPGAPFSFYANPSGTPSVVTYVATSGLAPVITNPAGSTVDQVNLDVKVARSANPVVLATEIKDTVSLINRIHDQKIWKPAT